MSFVYIRDKKVFEPTLRQWLRRTESEPKEPKEKS